MKEIYLLTIGYKRISLVLHGLFLIFTVIYSVLLGTCIFSVPADIILSNKNKIQNLNLEIMFTFIFLFIGVLLIVNYFVRKYFEDESSNLDKLFDIGQSIPDLYKYLRNQFLNRELGLFSIDLILYIILNIIGFQSVIVIFLKLCILINLGFRILYSGFIILLLRNIFKEMIEAKNEINEIVSYETELLVRFEKKKKKNSALLFVISLVIYAVILIIYLKLNSNKRVNVPNEPKFLALLTLIVFPLIITPITYPIIINFAKLIRLRLIQKMKLFHTITGKIYLKITDNKWKTHFKVISIFWLIAGIWCINSLYTYQNILQKEEIDYKYGNFDYRFNYLNSDEILPVLQNYSTQVMNENSGPTDTFSFFYTHLNAESEKSLGWYTSYEGILLDINQSNFLDYVELDKIHFSSDDQNNQKEVIIHRLYESPNTIIISHAFALSKGLIIDDNITFYPKANDSEPSILYTIIGIVKHCPLFYIDSPDTLNHFIISNSNNISSLSTHRMNFYAKSDIILSTNTIRNDLEETYNVDMENLDFNIGSKYEDQIITKNSFLGKVLYLQQYPLFIFLIIFLYIFLKKGFKEFESVIFPVVSIYGGDNVNFIKEFKMDLQITFSIQIILFNLITALNYFFMQYILNHLLYTTIKVEYFGGFADILEEIWVTRWDLNIFGTPLPSIYHIDLVLLLLPVFIIIIFSSILLNTNHWFPNWIHE